nr:uncharacterized protein LOC123759356 isoform X1 [Procambarus clarkii]
MVVLEEPAKERSGALTPPPSPHHHHTTTTQDSSGDNSSISSNLSAGSTSFTIGGATMSSGSGGSTKYMLRDTAPTHNNRLSVINTSRSHSGRLHYARRTPTPEASRYEPNFMLGSHPSEYPEYDTSYTIRSASPRTSRKPESRYMVRPKIRAESRQYDPRLILQPPSPELPQSFGSRHTSGNERKELEAGTLYDNYWHIPRASLWCSHKGCVYDSQPCKECQWKQEESASTCSSINPPPTFTALDNYRPVRPRPKCHQCSCGIIFAITTIFSLLVLFLITGFILYIEMVLKHQTANVTDRM